MTLTIIPQGAVEELRARLSDPAFVRTYLHLGPDLSGFTPLKSALDTADPPSLVVAGKTKQEKAATDLENAVRVHEWLGTLDETVASDQRLWITLTHREFFKYASWRWPVELGEAASEDKVEAARRHIISHWFFRGGGLAAMRRNAVARLWWAAHLTHAPWERDPELAELRKDDRYFFTRVLLRNQDIYQGLIEREFAVNRRILAAVLELIARDLPNRGNSAFVTELLKQVNLIARYRELTVVPINELLDELEQQLRSEAT